MHQYLSTVAYSISDTAWEQKQQWPVQDVVVDCPLELVFKALDPDKTIENVSQDDAFLVLKSLAEHVLEQFAASSVPFDNDSDSEEEDDVIRMEEQPERIDDGMETDSDDDFKIIE